MAKWTKEVPTVPGYYWRRSGVAGCDPEVVQLDNEGKFWSTGWEYSLEVGEMNFDTMAVFAGEFWSEKINPPGETSGA